MDTPFAPLCAIDAPGRNIDERQSFGFGFVVVFAVEVFGPVMACADAFFAFVAE